VRLLAAALLLLAPAAAESRFKQFDQDLKTAARELRIARYQAEIRESGKVVWKHGTVHRPARAEPVVAQEVEGVRVEWWFNLQAIAILIPATRLELVVSADSNSLTDAPRLTDGNILRSTIALAFLEDLAIPGRKNREELIDRSFIALYFGRREDAIALAHQALGKFPELEFLPDVTILYLFSQLGLAETESLATAVIKTHPSLPTAWFYYGQYLEKNKRYREAAACYEMITEHDPPFHNWTVAAAREALTHLKSQ
jgi:tetratricopeptide (TPR) repeat protein